MAAGVDPLVFVGLVLLALLGVLSWLTRRIQGGSLGRGAGRDRMALTAQHSVHVIELAGVRLLVGTGPSGAPRVLADLGVIEEPKPKPERSPEPTLARPWAELVSRFGFGVAGGR